MRRRRRVAGAERYTFYAGSLRGRARGIASNFLETAEHEEDAPKRYFELLEGLDVEIKAGYRARSVARREPRGRAAGEHEEWTNIYRRSGRSPRRKGSPPPRDLPPVAEVEVEHEKRYLRLLAREERHALQAGEAIRWKCAKCGRVHEGTEPPERCPTCAHPQGWLSRRGELLIQRQGRQPRCAGLPP